MRKGNTIKVSTTLLVLLMGFSLVACGSSAPALQPPVNNTEESSPATEPPQESDVIEASGILTGWADPHTVEIRVNDKAMSFQVGEDMQKLMDDLDDEDTVQFKYVEKTIDSSIKQRVLTEITKVASADDDNQGSGTGEAVTSDRPATSKLEVTVEGITEKRPVTLAQAKGYSLYIFEPMAFDAEEHELTMKIDPAYKVEMEKLSSDFDLEEVKMDARKELAKNGEVKELTTEQLSNGPMKDARLFMMSQNEKKTQYVIVKELDGNGFIFHIDAPVGEPSEGFLPMVYASINSIMKS